MVIVKLMGGLGNQLQQYALYQKFISLGKDAYLDLSWFDADTQAGMAARRECELRLFPGASFREATGEQVSSLIGDGSFRSKLCKKLLHMYNHRFTESGMFHPQILDMDDVYLEGYWAAEKYYADILPLLREQLAFEDISEANQKVAEDIVSREHACAVHIRRGDYLDPINASVFGDIATPDYYDASLSVIRELYPDTQFYIFSDDQAYVNERYGDDERCTIVDINHGLNSRYDIYLMSQCDMHVCANSTFSFWGARLSRPDIAGNIRIRPTIQKNSQIFDYDVMKELWKGWIFVDPKGQIYR